VVDGSQLKTQVNFGQLSAVEINNAMTHLVIMLQKETFSQEIDILLQNKMCKKGPLTSLNPYSDS